MAILQEIKNKIMNGERLTKADGLALYDCNDLSELGALADMVRQRISGDYVYYNVNRHIVQILSFLFVYFSGQPDISPAFPRHC